MSDVVAYLRAMDASMQATAPDAHVSMLVGVYVGLILGTRRPELAVELRAEIETSLGEALGIPPEALEAEFRQLVEPRG